MGTPTKERTELLAEIAAKIKATDDPKIVSRLAAQYAKIDKKNTPNHRPKLVEPEETPASTGLWKQEDLHPIKAGDTPEEIADKNAANEIIKAPGFWTLVDGERWGPVMKKQGRYFPPVNGDPVGEWEETVTVLDEIGEARNG